MSEMVITDPRSIPSVTATDAKNGFGRVLERALVEGVLAITKHNEVKAVLLSAREYEALIAGQRDRLTDLEAEFDGLLDRMRTAKARKAGEELFAASPSKLGRAALAARRERG